MENATKALIIIAGVLIGIMILSLGVALFYGLENYVQATKDKMEVNAQNAFNTQFTNFIGNNLRIQDVITAASKAYENNTEHNANYYGAGAPSISASQMYVGVFLDGIRLDTIVNTEMAQKLQQNNENIYECTGADVIMSGITGRVFQVNFSTK